MMKLDAGLTTTLSAPDPNSTAAWGSKRINPNWFVFGLEWMLFQSTMTNGTFLLLTLFLKICLFFYLSLQYFSINVCSYKFGNNKHYLS